MNTEKALNKIAGQCSKKEYCTKEVREKLSGWELDEEAIDKIVAFLIHHKFVDDTRYARIYAEDKFRFNHWGKQKINMMLHQKGISSDIISEALAIIDKDHYDNSCMEILQQKLKNTTEPDPYKLRAKLTRFALSRGFDYDIINKCVEELLS